MCLVAVRYNVHNKYDIREESTRVIDAKKTNIEGCYAETCARKSLTFASIRHSHFGERYDKSMQMLMD